MARLMIINCIVFGALCGLLGLEGISYKTWQFWVFVLGIVILQINNSFQPD